MGSRSSEVRAGWPALLAAAAIAGMGMASAGWAQPLTPADQERLRALERRANERLAVLQREADQLARQQRGLLDQLRALEVKRDLAAADLQRADAALALARAELAGIDATLVETERSLDDMKPTVYRRLVALYEAGPQGTLRAWLGSDDLLRSARATRLLAVVTARDRRAFTDYERLRADLTAQRAELERRRTETEQLRVRAVAAREQAVRAAAAHAALVRSVDQQRDLTARLAGELDTARTQLQDQLSGLSPESPATAALPIGPFKGTLPWPVSGRVGSAYGRQSSSRFGTAVARSGVEVNAAKSSQVHAVHDGRVVFADTFAGFGRLVIVDHGNKAFSLYGYLDEIAVQKGDSLERGQAIGASGESPDGRASVYFELRIDGRPVNPIEWLKR